MDGRNDKGRFVKGNKAGGRKKIPEEVKQMLLAATPDATQLLIDTMMDKEAALNLRLDCANKIIERVYGKAAQPLMAADSEEGLKVLIEIEGGNGVKA